LIGWKTIEITFENASRMMCVSGNLDKALGRKFIGGALGCPEAALAVVIGVY
jgi:hypothetical protein